MRSLYLRIYLTVVAVLLLFAAVSGWVFQRHLEQERARVEGLAGDRTAAWAELLQRALPAAGTSAEEQAAALDDWSARLRLALALDDAAGKRIAATASFERRQSEDGARVSAVSLDDGRRLWIVRPARVRPPFGAEVLPGPRPPGHDGPHDELLLPFAPPWLPRGVGVLLFLSVLFLAVAAGAYPVVRRLTRRLEALKRGVERFGAGQLDQRVEVSGRDEVAAVAASFNHAASRVEALVQSNRSLLANASHELRSPLARMKMAVSMLDEVSPQQRAELKREIETNVGELDALVEEVLLASRLGAAETLDRRDRVDLLGLVAEEAARVDAQVEGPALQVQGDERLLRRALRNLLENARRYGGGDVSVELVTSSAGAEIRIRDRGPGVPEAYRERIFEPFYRLPGHAEQAGGVGLGLSLVRQIAERHGGSVRCELREGGGSVFVLTIPRA